MFTDDLKVFRNTYAVDAVPNTMFMGFGYNGTLWSDDPQWQLWPSSERFDLLQYFAYMRAFKKRGVSWVIWDASGFKIVNSLPEKRYTGLGENPTPEDILDALISEQDRPKRRAIMNNCDERNKALNRFSSVAGVDALVIDSRRVFREDKRYVYALENALRYVKELSVDAPELIQNIFPKNGNSGSRFYLPLEIAEVLYLQDFFGIKGKFGPTTEEYFDRCILGIQNDRRVGYTALQCPTGPVRPGYLDDRSPGVLRLSNRDQYWWCVLGDDPMVPAYKAFVASYLEPFRQDEEAMFDCAIRLKVELGGRKEGFLFGTIPDELK